MAFINAIENDSCLPLFGVVKVDVPSEDSELVGGVQTAPHAPEDHRVGLVLHAGAWLIHGSLLKPLLF